MVPSWKQNLNRRGRKRKIAETIHSNYDYRQWRSAIKRHKARNKRKRRNKSIKRNIGNQFKAA